jgi:multisubunit Na+/H+ antiporter MnhC subunit
MATEEEARAAGLAAAAYAQDVADKAEHAAGQQGFLDRAESAVSSVYHAVVDPITGAVHDAATALATGEQAASDFGKTVVDAVKWVLIVMAIVVGALLVMWMVVALTGARWALDTLKAIAPDVAVSAASIARITG